MNEQIPTIEISPFDTRLEPDENGDLQEVSILIPQCCREGWASCKHVVKKQKKLKTNIGL